MYNIQHSILQLLLVTTRPEYFFYKYTSLCFTDKVLRNCTINVIYVQPCSLYSSVFAVTILVCGQLKCLGQAQKSSSNHENQVLPYTKRCDHPNSSYEAGHQSQTMVEKARVMYMYKITLNKINCLVLKLN